MVSIVSESSAQRQEILSTLLTAQLCYHVIMSYACETAQPNIVKHWKLGTFWTEKYGFLLAYSVELVSSSALAVSVLALVSLPIYIILAKTSPSNLAVKNNFNRLCCDLRCNFLEFISVLMILMKSKPNNDVIRNVFLRMNWRTKSNHSIRNQSGDISAP